jgi:hypothetical protein
MYSVRNYKKSNEHPRLVWATSRSAARNHVARDELDAEVASQETIVNAIRAGVEVETAGEPAGEASA